MNIEIIKIIFNPINAIKNNMMSKHITSKLYIINIFTIFMFSLISFHISKREMVELYTDIIFYILSNIIWIVISFVYFRTGVSYILLLKNIIKILLPYMVVYNTAIGILMCLSDSIPYFTRTLLTTILVIWVVFQLRLLKQHIVLYENVNNHGMLYTIKQYKAFIVSSLIILFVVTISSLYYNMDFSGKNDTHDVNIRANTYNDCILIYNTLIDRMNNDKRYSDEEEFALLKSLKYTHGYNHLNVREFELHEYLREMSNSLQIYYDAKEKSDSKEEERQKNAFLQATVKAKKLLDSVDVSQETVK